ncbi:hypothetical protein C7M84_007545 [Penaeus vannamei]|uniref:Uncharacterized protein n=1 Tax=Penaeus vannamei TaxID=6689 RepID=A0A3R7QBU3_PENVA|nr:hypothetical protein C7M84_007545 [Penaeus vannamei]
MEFNVASGRIVLGILLVLSIASCDLERTRNPRDTQGRTQGRVGTRGPPRFPRDSRPRRPRCPSATRNLTLTKEVVLELLQEVAHYLRASELVLVIRREYYDTCISLGKNLYRRGMPTSCTNRTTLQGYYHALVFLELLQKDDPPLSSILEEITEITEEGRLQVLHLVFITDKRVPAPSVNASLSFCLIQPRENQIEFREVLTFGGNPPGQPAEDVASLHSSIIPPTSSLLFSPYPLPHFSSIFFFSRPTSVYSAPYPLLFFSPFPFPFSHFPISPTPPLFPSFPYPLFSFHPYPPPIPPPLFLVSPHPLHFFSLPFHPDPLSLPQLFSPQSPLSSLFFSPHPLPTHSFSPIPLPLSLFPFPFQAAPYTIVTTSPTGEMQVEGYLVDLLGVLQQHLNFR